MIIIKGILLFLVFASCTYIGKMFSNQYKKRVEELQEMKKSFLVVETKMKYTYDLLPEILKEVGVGLVSYPNIGNIFINASKYMKNQNAKESWENAVEECKTSMTKEDISVIKDFGKLIRKNRYGGTS